MDAQAGLRLYCSQTPEDMFSRVKAFMIHVKGQFCRNYGFLKIQCSKYGMMKYCVFVKACSLDYFWLEAMPG